jgi:hypothetical protein
MKSKHGRVGMMENIWKKIQAPLGQMLHLGLAESQVRECTSINEYLTLFLRQSQMIQEDSVRAKQNRLRYERSSPLNAEGDVNTKVNSVRAIYPSDPSLNYLNHISPNPLMHYNNPYYTDERSEMPHRTPDFLKPVNPNRYDPDNDEYILDYDYCDESDMKSVLNPLYHKSPDIIDNLQSPDEDSVQVSTTNTNLNYIDKSRTQPCYKALFGQCKDGSGCIYSHDKPVLQAAFDKKMQELSSSPFAKSARNSSFSGDQRRNFTPSPFTPASKPTHLREMYGPLSNHTRDLPVDLPPCDESDRVHRSSARYKSSTPLPDPQNQVTILNKNCV